MTHIPAIRPLFLIVLVVLALSALAPRSSVASGRPTSRSKATPTARPKATPVVSRTVNLADVEVVSEGVYRATMDGAWALFTAKTTHAPLLKNGRWQYDYLMKYFTIQGG